ncbi:FecCD family ABC transporter permease [Pseudemcibacter aquimaris]|uniref:FecCD family ABC transporter permease n=1 Tax=Pseudemcibacter aquimaris TaxID=2857064 RepID=UPI0020111CEF|nr:iron ABC transporter permease [Pseudemcibacter aquimaris]MCC3861525.1 iron ABC transporter permease [Pseudemcibacter aquimaris]WDU58294.1 iron ABC transporter permease [Pseudemcibacter aquimaris]
MTPFISHKQLNLLLTLLLISISFASLFIGSVDLSIAETFTTLIGGGSDTSNIIIYELRFPRVFMGILAGATLGLSGAALQGMLRNPLADPGIIGVSSMAGLGAVIAIYFGLTALFPAAIQIMAIAGALIAIFILMLIASKDSSVLTLILSGVAISSLATAAISVAMNFAPNPMTLQEMVMWMLGSLENRTIYDISISLPFILVGWLMHVGISHGLDALSLGEETAKTMGINTKNMQLRIIIGSALSVGAVVAACGAIGFIGLVVPHIIRRISGYEPGKLLIPSALMGAVLLMLADLLTRVPFGAGQLRLGVVTAIIGAPMFLYIIFKTRRTMR